MKYLRVRGRRTGPEGAFGRLDGKRVQLLDRPPFDGTAQPTGDWLEWEEIEAYLPPAAPPNIFALGVNYARHGHEFKESLPTAPLIFLKATTSLAAHGDPILLPGPAPDEVDYEAELVVVIGRRARNVPPEKALEHVFGYTCGNDVTARDCQMKYDRQWTRAKSFDTFAPVGPVIETGLDPARLRIASRLNGQVMQEASTVSYLSRQFTLLPQTLIMTGTPSGVGFARRPPVFLRPGDRIEIEIEGIGVLVNPVAAAASGAGETE